ncbi:hypothetical protein [Saccharibacillus kuerlensis]|uniref:Uncharacterized protein n=1 Tax=Saccharibacillus kuerlensis TaxID=459527 RepID=A0ABQ2L986_9BACL|nr:hypothetical protein [Saccharibacillus kuerlensis]GGO07365.1 hypothetical protein GCM10010969_35770 [Saccharibacillus kuerlensis]
MNTYKELISNEEFFAAALFQIYVFVIDVLEDSPVGNGGAVEKYTDFSVWIDGECYPRHTHTFKVAAVL